MISAVKYMSLLRVDTSVICNAMLILCLGSFLLQDMFYGSKYWLSRDKD